MTARARAITGRYLLASTDGSGGGGEKEREPISGVCVRAAAVAGRVCAPARKKVNPPDDRGQGRRKWRHTPHESYMLLLLIIIIIMIITIYGYNNIAMLQ